MDRSIDLSVNNTYKSNKVIRVLDYSRELFYKHDNVINEDVHIWLGILCCIMTGTQLKKIEELCS